MSKKLFTINEAENMFEIGRIMQMMINNDIIEVEDSKEMFVAAMKIALDFEEKYGDTEDYYNDLDVFVVSELGKQYGGKG